MKSVRFHRSGDLRIHAEPISVAGEGERLVRVRAMGVCGSDLHWVTEGAIGDAKLERLLVLGHEFAGETDHDQRVLVNKSSCK
jgi:L-iditol 2-dehydrogenase